MFANNARLANAQMRQKVEADSNKLLKLVSQLNSEISHSGRDSLTDDEAKKFAEIGKLARKVRGELANHAPGL